MKECRGLYRVYRFWGLGFIGLGLRVYEFIGLGFRVYGFRV